MDERKLLKDDDEGVTWRKKYFKYVPLSTLNITPMSATLLILNNAIYDICAFIDILSVVTCSRFKICIHSSHFP